jgi:hypothetical protein
MNFTSEFTFIYLANCLQGLLYGMILILRLSRRLLKEVKNYPVPGLYCGIFAMYFQYHISIEGTKNMLLFYALSVLYLLSTGVILCDIVFLVIDLDLPVSNNKLFFFFLNLALINGAERR